jgi:excisionase family DNA binding protein
MKAEANNFHPDQLLPSKTAAEFLAVSVRHLYNLRIRKRLPFVRIEGSVRFQVRDLLHFINERRCGHAATLP